MRIVVLDGHTLNPGDLTWKDIEEFGELTVYDRTPPQEVRPRAADAEIILTNKTPITAELLEELPRLRFVSVLATGYNVVDVPAAGRRGIVVSNVPIYATDAVAQFAFALLLELCHHAGAHDRAVRRGEWGDQPDFCFWKTPLVELAGRRMGIVGFGRIGRRVGELAHAFGMEVLAADVAQSNPPAYQPFAWREVADLFAEADAISLHCPQTPENAGFVNADLIGRMKPTAFLINTARGGLIVERDLADALDEGRIAGAGLDVVSSEPVRADNPLLGARNCIITPHVAWATLAARARLMRTTAENIAAFLKGSPVNVVS